MKAAASGAPDPFVTRFARFWERPDPDHALELFQPEIHLVAPMLQSTSGMPAARQAFAQALELLPDLRAEVKSWAAHDSSVFIELEFSASSGGLRLRWPAVDRIKLRDGLASERVSYFDSLPLARQTGRHPMRLWANVRAGIRPRVPAPRIDTAASEPDPEADRLEERLAAAVERHYRDPRGKTLLPLLTREAVADSPGRRRPAGEVLARRAHLLRELLGSGWPRVMRWGIHGPALFVEVAALDGGGRVCFALVDQLHVDGDRVSRIRSFYDSYPLLQRAVRRPTLLRHLVARRPDTR